MKAGLTAGGVYVPYYRIGVETINAAWGGRGGKGELGVGYTDEDSITMAVEAARNSLTEENRKQIDLLYFASVTAPYAEKGQAGLIAMACDLDNFIGTADFAQSTRSGTSALKAALDAVLAGSARQALVTAADTRVAYPKSGLEQILGDGAAAVVVGKDGVIATLDGFCQVNNEIIDYWRNYGERYVRSTEGRFMADEGYQAAMKMAVKGLLSKLSLAPETITKAVFSSPGLKDSERLAKSLGFGENQVQNNLVARIGDTGSAQPLMMLIAALEEASAGDRILLAGYGSGADAFLFTVTEEISSFKAEQRLRKALEINRKLTSYSLFLSFKDNLQTNPGEPFRTFPSNAAYKRDARSILNFRGSVCRVCGAGMFPVNRICCNCQSKDDYDEIRLAERKAKVFTYSIDNLAGRGDDPVVVQTVAEDGRGVRYYLLMTDFEKSEVSIGMDLEFVFRKIYEGGNYINYFWKCRPVRHVEGD